MNPQALHTLAMQAGFDADTGAGLEHDDEMDGAAFVEEYPIGKKLIKFAQMVQAADRNERDELVKAEREIERLSAELANWQNLRDPATLHANLLRGLPAQLTREQAMHLCADDLQRMAELEAEVESLRAELAAERERCAKLRAALQGLVRVYVIDGAATTPAREIGDAWKAAQRALLRA